MTRIKNKNRIPLVVPKLDDYFVGSQQDNNGKTVNFDFNSVINTINEANGFSTISYKFSAIEDATTEEGYFNTNGGEVTFSAINQIVINTTDLNDSDLTALLGNITTNKENVVLYLKDPSSQSLYYYFKVTASSNTAGYFTLTVERLNTLSVGSLSEDTSYVIGFIAVPQSSNADWDETDVDNPAHILNKPENTGDFNNNGEGSDRFVEDQELGEVAFSNDYVDLDNKPTIPTNTGDLINNGEGSDRFVEDQELGEVAFSNDYSDLDNKPVFKVVENEYATMSTLYADQGNQTNSFIQYVVDASGHPEVVSGSAYFEYLGTTVGDNTDYRLLSDEESAPISGGINKTSDIPVNDGSTGVSPYVEQQDLSVSEVIVKDKSQIINQVLLSDKVYVIDTGITLLAGESIIVPAGGLTLVGRGFNISSLFSSATNHTIFTSPIGGSGDLVLLDLSITTTGSGSQVFDIVDSDNSHAIEIQYVNFSGCISLGKQDSYRQGTWTTVGVYGCDDGLQLSGTWNGYKVSNSNCFGFGSSGTIFKKDVDTVFTNRLFLNVNIDLPTGAKLADFQSSNFSSNELFQINSSIAKLNGVLNINNGELLVPNISPNDLKSLWVGNIGLPDSATEAYVENFTVSGSYNIDWLKDTYNLTMTGDTTFTESNLPASSKNTQEIKVYLTGEFTPTFPANWETNMVGTYKGSDVNEISVKYIKDGVYFVKISNSLSVYPAPILGSVVPVSLLPSSTSELRLKGSFFTPAGFVLIDGQVINNIEFDADTGDYILSVTTGSVEGEFDITISNGTSITFDGRLIVNLGEVFIPTELEWEDTTGSTDLTEDGAVKTSTIGVAGQTYWEREFDYTKDFTVKFKITKSNLGFDSSSGFDEEVSLCRVSNNSAVHITELARGGASQILYRVRGTGGGNVNLISANETTREDTFDLIVNNKEVELRYDSTTNIISSYYEGVLKDSRDSALVENVRLRIKVKIWDVVSIKYIETP